MRQYRSDESEHEAPYSLLFNICACRLHSRLERSDKSRINPRARGANAASSWSIRFRIYGRLHARLRHASGAGLCTVPNDDAVAAFLAELLENVVDVNFDGAEA
jgi:hypothetical protein